MLALNSQLLGKVKTNPFNIIPKFDRVIQLSDVMANKVGGGPVTLKRVT